jgi:hypothetical protein
MAILFSAENGFKLMPLNLTQSKMQTSFQIQPTVKLLLSKSTGLLGYLGTALQLPILLIRKELIALTQETK